MKWYEYIGIILYVLFAYFINKMGFSSISLFIFFIGIVTAIIDIKKGSLFFFINSLASSDFVFENMYIESSNSVPLGGIYMANFAGATLMVYWCTLLLIIILLKKGSDVFYLMKYNNVLSILAIIFVASILGFSFNIIKGGEYVERTAISDIRFFVNIFVGFLVIHICSEDNLEKIKKLFDVFVLIFMVQTIITILSSYTASLQYTLYNFVTGTESYLIGIIFLYFLFLLLNEKNTLSSKSIIYTFCLLIMITYLVITAARGRIFLLGITLFLFCMYTKKYQYILYTPLVIFISLWLVSIINPNFIEYFIWKFTTFNPLGEGGESANVRYISFLNIIIESLSNLYYFIFGKGLGGYFETNHFSFLQDLRGGDAFHDTWIAEGKYYKPHGIILYSLLKFGVVMSFVLYYQIIKYCYQKLKNKYTIADISPMTISIALTLPIFFIVIYSSKLQILFGMLLAFLYLADFSKYETMNENNEKRV